MREIAEVAGITTQTLLNNVRLLEPYFEMMEQKKSPRCGGTIGVQILYVRMPKNRHAQFTGQ